MPIRTRWSLTLGRKLIATTLATVLLVPPVAAYASASSTVVGPSDPREVEVFMDGFFNRADVQASLTGAVVAVVQGDRTLLAKGYGYADLEKKTPVDPERTLFRLASISKTFTATAVMKLVEQSKVDLDRDIADYLGGVSIPNRTGTPLTMKHLLTHTGGFDYTDAAEDEAAPEEAPYLLESFIKDHIPTVVRKPGEAFRYDNYGYDLLGYIVQNVAGEPFEKYVTDHIFNPLGMKSSYFVLTPDVQERMATPHDGSGNALAQYATLPNNSPDGGMISTGADMSRFMIAELNGGRLGGASILKEQSLKEMQQLGFSIHPDMPGVGYGFESSFPNADNGQFVIDKGGVSTGFQSHVWLLPEKKTGLFIALNSARDARKLRGLLFQTFMDHYYPKQESPRTEAPLNQTKLQLMRLEGVYRDLRLPMWHYDIAAEDGGLIVTDSSGEHKLRQIKELLFEDESGRKAAFKEDGNGKIVYFFYNKADSWSEKLPDRKPYDDVPDDHPYAKFIYYVQQQGLTEKAGSRTFRPDQPITRAEFVAQLVGLSGNPLSTEPVLFSDAANHPYAAEIQTSLEFGIVEGTASGRFEPDRPITRQEAAVVLARALLLGFGAAGAVPIEAKLKGDTDEWALEGVETIVARGYYGPEIVPDADGAVDYRSKLPMLRQEAAAMFYRFP